MRNFDISPSNPDSVIATVVIAIVAVGFGALLGAWLYYRFHFQGVDSALAAIVVPVFVNGVLEVIEVIAETQKQAWTFRLKRARIFAGAVLSLGVLVLYVIETQQR